MSSDTQTWSSNGKLLITGEYLVMEGALALAVPLRKGQSLSVQRNNNKTLSWHAFKPDGNWFTADYELPSLQIIHADDISLAGRLKEILVVAKEISDDFLVDNIGFTVNTVLDFKPEFGFGSSSTLISNIAMWANINPYILLKNTFGGSGYDIACAQSMRPILYQLKNDDISVTDVEFKPPEQNRIYFVYLGKKKSSSEGIKAFKNHAKFTSNDIDHITEITKELILTNELCEFEKLLTEHESIISNVINLPTAKSLYFPDFQGLVKSLGAWGGDFVMVTNNESEDKLRSYMLKRGFDTVFSYNRIVL